MNFIAKRHFGRRPIGEPQPKYSVLTSPLQLTLQLASLTQVSGTVLTADPSDY